MTAPPASTRRKQVRKLLLEGFDEQDADVIHNVFADKISLMGHDVTMTPEDFQRDLESYYEAFPNLIHIIDSVLCSGDEIAIHYENVGTFENPLVMDNEMVSDLRVEPTGEEVNYRGVYLGRFDENGEIIEWINYPERLELFQEIGVFPAWNEVA